MNFHGLSESTASAPAERHSAVYLRLSAHWALPPPLTSVTQWNEASTDASTNPGPHEGCSSMVSWAKAELNRGPHLEMCQEQPRMSACARPVPAETKRGVRMQETRKNTRGQMVEESEGKKRHFLKCTSCFIPMNSLARHPTRSVERADTNHCIISRTWLIWDQLMLSTAVKPACPAKAYQFNPAYRAPGLSFPTCATELWVYIHEQWSYY